VIPSRSSPRCQLPNLVDCPQGRAEGWQSFGPGTAGGMKVWKGIRWSRGTNNLDLWSDKLLSLHNYDAVLFNTLLNPFAPDFLEDLLPKHKKSLKIHKTLIYWDIYIHRTCRYNPWLNNETVFFCIKTSITKYPGLITPLAQSPPRGTPQQKFKNPYLNKTYNA
jgi:hypothetical protein